MLPKISDPDGDSWTIDLNLGEAFLFSYFSNNTLKFSPTITNEKNTPYIIGITITDKNTYPKSSKY